MDRLLHGVGGSRLAWVDLPVEVREGIEARFGATVAEATSQAGGFSPGLASRLVLSDGRRAFVKAMSGAERPGSIGLYREEAAVVSTLPDTVPAPRCLWTDDDGDWVVLAFEDVGGRPPALPWRPDDLDRVLAALPALSAHPAPDRLPPLSVLADPDGIITGLRDLAAGDPRLSNVDPWLRARVDTLADLESRWGWAVGGDSLVHGDLRADNVLLTGDRVVFVDWPAAARGAPWFDLLIMLPSVGMQGGGDPAELFDRHPLARDTDPARVTAALAGITGYFLTRSVLPAPPGLPRVRRFQAAQGRVALDWLRRRL